MTQYQAQVQQAHDAYVAGVNQALDAVVGSARTVALGWKTRLEEFETIMPPNPPATAPTATAKSGGPSTPQGTDWVSGNKVQYAVQFRNDTTGLSDLGPWSNLLTIANTAYATVADIPADPLKLTTSVHVHRQFVGSGGKTGNPQVVSILQPGVTTFDDTKTS